MRNTNNKYRHAPLSGSFSLSLSRVFRDEAKLPRRNTRRIQEEKEGSVGRRGREKEITGVSARKTKGQRRIKSIADKATGQDAGAHLVSPGEWAFIMMPPGTNNRVHFVSPARGNNGADGRWRRRKRVDGGGRRGRRGGGWVTRDRVGTPPPS